MRSETEKKPHAKANHCLDKRERSERGRRPSVAYQRKDWIVAEILKGRTIASIAKDLGCSQPNISKRLARDPQYRTARRTAIEHKLLQAQSDYHKARYSRPQNKVILGLTRKRYRLALYRAQTNFPLHWPSRYTPSHGNPDLEAWKRLRSEAK